MAVNPLLFGTSCDIRYRWEGQGDPPTPGAYLATIAGSVYEIMETRPIAGDLRRLKLSCLRTDPAELREGAHVFDLVWDRRARR